jgi:Mg-chelatase subunit ChlD
MRKGSSATAAAAAVLLSCGGIYLWHSGRQSPPVPAAANPPVSVQPIAELVKDDPQPAAHPASHPVVDIVFALDTTSSMSGMITAAKAKIWDLARIAQQGQPTPELRVGLVAFRDRGDEYVTKKLDLTPDLDRVYARLTDLTAGGGGDGPEHVLKGLKDSLDESWSNDPRAVKLLYLVGDAPPHLDYQDGITVASVVAEARDKQVRITGIRCGAEAETLAAWQRFATPTDGEVASIDASGGVATVVTPFDKELASLNAKLAATEVHTGSAAERAAEDEAVHRSLTADPAAQADRAAFFGAAADAPAASGSFDLVRAAPTAVATARPEDLPDELRALGPADRQAYVDRKRGEREALVAQVKDLSAKREAYKTSSAPAPSPDSFDSKVYHAMKSAGSARGVSF